MGKILSILLILSVLVGSNSIYSDDFTDAIVKTKKKLNDIKDVSSERTTLLKVRGDFERILQLKKNEWMVNYWIAMCDLMIAWSYMGEKPDKTNLKKYTESSIDLLNKSTDMKDDFADAWVLKYSAQSNRWQYEMDKMNDIIAKSGEAKETAKKIEPTNPRLYLTDGFITFYTPENFGGGVDNALPLFEKSWEYFQTYTPKDETYPNWGKDQAAGMMAMCMIKNEKLDEAKKWIDKGLEADPESGFIKGMVMKEYEKAKK